jgi:hypothetical protein
MTSSHVGRLSKLGWWRLRHNTGFAHLVPPIVEQVHIADLLDPLRRRMMRRMGGTRHVIDKEGLVGRNLLELLHVLDGLVGHGRLQVPAGIALEGIDCRRIAKQVRLPLAGIAADKAVEIIEAHAIGPLIERPGLARLALSRSSISTMYIVLLPWVSPRDMYVIHTNHSFNKIPQSPSNFLQCKSFRQTLKN